MDVSPMGGLMDLQYCLTDFRDLTSCFFQICISLIYFESGSSGLAVKHEMSQICLPFGSVHSSLNGYNGYIYFFILHWFLI